MNLKEMFYRRLYMQKVAHTTLNPYGPGAVRIHLVPPRFQFRKVTPSVVILNGKDIIPLNPSYAILLNIFIDEVNNYDGIEVNNKDLENITTKTLNKAKAIYSKTAIDTFKEDLKKIITTLCDIAYGNEPSVEIGYMTLGEYAPNMKAPHRMDLMISAMTKNGSWNCNQKCLHCYAAGQNEAETYEISTEQWKQVIDKCKKIGIPQLTFTGGEPTLRKDLLELISYSRWFVTRLNTNGINLSRDFCFKLSDAELDSVQITLYSHDKNIHNKLVNAEKYHMTVNGINNALLAGLNVSINTPLCKINKDYLSTLKFLYGLGIKYVSCSGLIVTGNACKEESRTTQLTEDELFSVLKDAVEYCNEVGIEISFTSPGWISEEKLNLLNLSIPTCGACLSNMAISPSGNVIPCQSWLNSNFVLGNILNDSWKKIWNKGTCKEIRSFSSGTAGICPLRNENFKEEVK